MPYVANMEDEQQNPNAPQGAVSPTGGGAGAVRLSPSTGIGTAGGGMGATGGTNPSPTAGGQFASLQNYLSANQGQAAPLANKITTGVGQQYQTLAGQNTSTLNDINSQVAANALPNPNATLSQEAANPVSFASNPSNISSFQKLLNASYSGPASAESTNQYQTQQAAINNAIAQGQANTQTEAGRENLISQSEATPTAGVTALNSAILSQDPNAAAAVQTAYDPFSNLLTGLSGGAADINKSIAQTQGDIAQANQQANQQIQNQYSGLNQQISGENQAAYQAANTQYQNLLNQVNTIGATPEIQTLMDNANAILSVPGHDNAQATQALNALTTAVNQHAQDVQGSAGNLAPLVALEQQAETPVFIPSPTSIGHGSAWTPAQAVDLSQFFSGSAPIASQFATATPDELARGAALNQLTGTSTFAAPTPSSTYTAPTFNVNAAQTALQNAIAQGNQAATQQAAQISAQQQAQHNASKHGFFKNVLNAISGPAGYIVNPLLNVPSQVLKTAQKVAPVVTKKA